MRHQESKAVWYEPGVTPRCPEGGMIPVILQRRGRVFGGWYLNEYLLADEDDALDGEIDADSGFKRAVGFFDKAPNVDFDDYYEQVPLKDLDCWAYMPPPRRTVVCK